MAQGSEFPLKKPPSFHYDFFLLGITTLIAGLLGLPAPNGLIPQAPIHTASLVVWGLPANEERDEKDIGTKNFPECDDRYCFRQVPISVVEQRISNLAQGALCLVLLTGPFLHVLSLIPRGVLAGLLCVYSFQSDYGRLTCMQLVYGTGCPELQRDHDKDLLSDSRQVHIVVERTTSKSQKQQDSSFRGDTSSWFRSYYGCHSDNR